MVAEVNTDKLESLGLMRRERLEKDTLGQDDFLELMTAQLKNQDPLNPMENGEFLSQIAQFGTVRGIQDLQKTFTDLATSISSNQALQAAGLVGRSVLLPGNFAVTTQSGQGLKGAVNLEFGAETVTVDVIDRVGQAVKQITLGPQQEGLSEFSWDGTDKKGQPVPPGTYFFRATARVGGSEVGSDTLVSAPVESVSLGGGAISLNLTGLGARDFNDVVQIR